MAKDNDTFTKGDLTLILDAIANALASARRQQNLKGSQPMILEAYQKIEKDLITLHDKVRSHKERTPM